jgi:hypothetical protein
MKSVKNMDSASILKHGSKSDEEMVMKSEWSDIPCKKVNYFTFHRFFIVKSY